MSEGLEKRIERLETLLGEGERVIVIPLAVWAIREPTEADLTAPYREGEPVWIARDRAVTLTGGSLERRRQVVEAFRAQAREKAAQVGSERGPNNQGETRSPAPTEPAKPPRSTWEQTLAEMKAESNLAGESA